jgi:hypothetical protein
MLLFNRETTADDRRLFNRATRAIKRDVIPLARDKNQLIRLMGIHRVLKLTMPQVIMFNRRHTQTCADSTFSLADLARENLHALRANRFFPKR